MHTWYLYKNMIVYPRLPSWLPIIQLCIFVSYPSVLVDREEPPLCTHSPYLQPSSIPIYAYHDLLHPKFCNYGVAVPVSDLYFGEWHSVFKFPLLTSQRSQTLSNFSKNPTRKTCSSLFFFFVCQGHLGIALAFCRMAAQFWRCPSLF